MRLKWLASRGAWFTCNQHGFVEGKSTITALSTFVDAIEAGFVKEDQTLAVFLDIKAAFDNAWHPASPHQLVERQCPTGLIHPLKSSDADAVQLSHTC